MKIYDISMAIFYDMPVYKGKSSKRPVIKVESDYTTGSVYETRLDMNMHTGTHLDSPLHILQNGKNLDALDLKRVIRPCKVLDLKHIDNKITQEHLICKKIEPGDFILLKTKNSFLDILQDEFIYLDKTGAAYLRSKGVSGVGIDSLGIERSQPDHETHKMLLEEDIIILEGLRLKDVEEGEYLLVAAPIKVLGTEAAPVRALLIEEN